MRVRFAFVVGLVLALAALSSVTQAATAKDSFAYHIGDGFGPLNATGDQAVAENGDKVTVKGNGTFDVVEKTATGGGTFVHKNASGAVLASGAWHATGLLAFQSYGPVAAGSPLFGGRASLTVTLTPAGTTLEVPGILEIECLLGNPPSGTEEGIRLLIKGHLNFNKTVEESGENVFVRL